MDNSDLNKLSKKNQEFIHIATNQLIKNGKTDEEIKAALADIIPTILENQNKGITARQIYKAPTVWADSLTAKEQIADKPAENDNPWLMWLDTSLFVFGIMGLVTGALSLFSPKAQTYGIVSHIILSISVGGMMYAMYYFVYRHMGKPKPERPNFLKSLAMLILVMLGIFLSFGITAFLPIAINPVLPAWITIIIGGIGLGARYLLKKRYNIKNAMTSKV